MNLITSAWNWLAGVWPYLPWALVVIVPCWLAPWGVRLKWPHAWEWFASVGDRMIRSLPLPFAPLGTPRPDMQTREKIVDTIETLLSKSFQALPSTMMGALIIAIVSQADPHTTLVEYFVGAVAPVGHELLKLVIPGYVGGSFRKANKVKAKKAAARMTAASMIFMLCLSLVLVPFAGGCAAMPALLPIISGIVAVVQEAQSVLDKIDAVSQVVLPSLPKDVQVQWAKKMANTRQALAGISKLAQGGKDLQQQDVDKAFAEFAAVYRDLTAFAEDIGLMSTAPGGDVHVHVAGAKAGLHVVIVDPAAARQRPVQVAR